MKKPQTLSLQEQLLKSGLASDAKAKQVKADKRKQAKQQRNNGVEIVDEVKLKAEQARLQQAERDRELNQLRKQSEEQKALAAQLRQIVETNRIAQDEQGVAYRFNDANKVKTVYVSSKVRDALSNGLVGIIRLEGHYELAPTETVLKIQERFPDSIALLNRKVQDEIASEEDPYSEYRIPDDLMW